MTFTTSFMTKNLRYGLTGANFFVPLVHHADYHGTVDYRQLRSNVPTKHSLDDQETPGSESIRGTRRCWYCQCL